MTEREKLVETMVRAYYDDECGETGFWDSSARLAETDEFAARELEECRKNMEAALDAAEEQLGAVMVPLEAAAGMIQAMQQSGYDFTKRELLNAANAASPYRKAQESGA